LSVGFSRKVARRRRRIVPAGITAVEDWPVIAMLVSSICRHAPLTTVLVYAACVLLALGSELPAWGEAPPTGAPLPESWRELADRNLQGPLGVCRDIREGTIEGCDDDGYGGAAWGLAYAMAALNVLYEATGEVAYLEYLGRIIENLFAKRDDKLAQQYGEAGYVDYARGRVLKAWGTGHYTGGRHTCHLVHAGMLLYPMADFVRIVRAGGPKTSHLRAQADRIMSQIEETIHEFDDEWRNGPQPNMGYYVDVRGKVLPNNWQSAMGRVFVIMAEVTGDAGYRDKATRIAHYIKSKLTRVVEGDYYVWAYSQPGPEGPAGSGEDISHAAITAHFIYVAWEHGIVFTMLDMHRLSRTFTRAIYLGNGQVAAWLGTSRQNDSLGAQCIRWAFLARFDPQVPQMIRAYMAAHPTSGALGGPTAALGFAYLARAPRLRRADAEAERMKALRYPSI